MYRRILVASDLTEASMPAMRAALHLARRLDAEVIALHVTQPPYPANHWFVPQMPKEASFFREIAARERVAAERVLEQQVADARVEPHDGVATRTIVTSGIPSDVIVEVARQVEADLLVMGTHARKGLQHMVMGSVAERVLRTAPCPVLTVRAGGK